MAPETERQSRLPGALFALVLGLGYLAAVANLTFTFAADSGQYIQTPRTIAAHFHGDPLKTRLTQMLNGAMGKFLESPAEKHAIFDWVAGGAKEPDYPKVAGIFEDRCVRCHSDIGRASFRPLTTYAEVSVVTKPDRGPGWDRLARLSHQHLFGIGLLCLAAAWLLWRQTNVSVRTKQALTVLGFAGMLLDIGGWWLTKLAAPFAWAVLIGGAMTGLFFAASIVLIWRDFFAGAEQSDA